MPDKKLTIVGVTPLDDDAAAPRGRKLSVVSSTPDTQPAQSESPFWAAAKLAAPGAGPAGPMVVDFAQSLTKDPALAIETMGGAKQTPQRGLIRGLKAGSVANAVAGFAAKPVADLVRIATNRNLDKVGETVGEEFRLAGSNAATAAGLGMVGNLAHKVGNIGRSLKGFGEKLQASALKPKDAILGRMGEYRRGANVALDELVDYTLERKLPVGASATAQALAETAEAEAKALIEQATGTTPSTALLAGLRELLGRASSSSTPDSARASIMRITKQWIKEHSAPKVVETVTQRATGLVDEAGRPLMRPVTSHAVSGRTPHALAPTDVDRLRRGAAQDVTNPRFHGQRSAEQTWEDETRNLIASNARRRLDTVAPGTRAKREEERMAINAHNALSDAEFRIAKRDPLGVRGTAWAIMALARRNPAYLAAFAAERPQTVSNVGLAAYHAGKRLPQPNLSPTAYAALVRAALLSQLSGPGQTER